MSRYFALITVEHTPKNAYHKDVLEFARSHNRMVLEDNASALTYQEHFIGRVKELHNQHPRCNALRIDTQDYRRVPGEGDLILVIYGLVHITLFKEGMQ